jgi:gamma-glutamyltranspeptidase/glutathione hydrolase
MIMIEPNQFEKNVVEELRNIGYTIDERNSRVIGKVDAILVLKNGKLEAGADPRGDDTAIGF